MRTYGAFVAVLLVLGGCTATAEEVAKGALPAGSGVARFEGLPGKAMRVFYHRPAAFRSRSPILVVLHGVRRNAGRYRDAWRDLSGREGFLVLAPEFARADFPGGRAYNRGNMRTAAGDPVPPRAWSFNAVERLFDAARRWTGSTREGYLLFGHSAGAQAAHRMITFMPYLRVERAVAANAGWYAMPDRSAPFPYGLQGSGADDAQLRAAFARRLIVMLGDADNDPNHRYLNNSDGARRQGAHRLARGLAYFDRAKALARKLGAPFGWRLEIVPDAGHSTKQVRDAALRALLQAARP